MTRDIHYSPSAVVEVADDESLTLLIDWSASENGEYDEEAMECEPSPLSARVSNHIDAWVHMTSAGEWDGQQRIPLGKLAPEVPEPLAPKVYVLLFHDVWDVREKGPEEVSVEGVFTSREAAEAWIASQGVVGVDVVKPAPLLDGTPEWMDENDPNADALAYYTLEERPVR
jgi:hypothetical protein